MRRTPSTTFDMPMQDPEPRRRPDPEPGEAAQRAIVRDGKRLFESRIACMEAPAKPPSRQVRRAAERAYAKSGPYSAIRRLSQ